MTLMQDDANTVQASVSPPAQNTAIRNPYIFRVPSSYEKEMGPQSQRRNGSVKACKKRATQAKHRRTPMARMVLGARLPFIRELHCKLCKIRAQPNGTETSKNYKKGHHPDCPAKPQDARTGQKTTMLAFVKRNGFAAEVSMANTIPTAVQPASNMSQNCNSATTTTSMGFTTDHLRPMGSIAPYKFGKESYFDAREELRDFVTDIKLELESKMAETMKNDAISWTANKAAPAVFSLAAQYLMEQVKHRRSPSVSAVLPQTKDFQDGISRYYELFPMGTCEFKFAKDISSQPSPVYHLLEEETMVYLDWQLSYPNLALPCPNCAAEGTANSDSFLCHDRTNFGKNKALFPIWTMQGTPIWCIVMTYACKSCKKAVRANDGQLLHMLPAHVSATYPVPPRYATSGPFHLHNEVVTFLDSVMKTYGNAEFVSAHLVQNLGRFYQTKLATYLSRNPAASFPSWSQFPTKRWPPCSYDPLLFVQGSQAHVSDTHLTLPTTYPV